MRNDVLSVVEFAERRMEWTGKLSLDLDKLENKHEKGHIIEARCPACWEEDRLDKTGNHLCIDK